MSDELFTTSMRKATRRAHSISDALVNAKLLFALNNDKVWGEGLLVFYEIFKFLEFAMNEKKDQNLGKLFMPSMIRTPAFEADLEHYIGYEWKKNYKIRDSVKNYLNHLKHLLETDSDLLMAYVYHLYMGLLSGGQLIRKKKYKHLRLPEFEGSNVGEAVTYFENEDINELKNQLRDKMNEIAEGLDENKKALLVKESVKVFELNNSILKSVEGMEKVALQNISVILACIFLVLGIIFGCRFLIQK